MSTANIFDCLSAISALIAAALWFLSSKRKVKPSSKPNEDGLEPAQIIVNGWDLIETMKLQAKLSAWAATAAAFSAIFYVLSSMVRLFGA
ncbi:hypothetical protein ACVNPS_02120 [Candidatus Bipolaricaulota sp. J31]